MIRVEDAFKMARIKAVKHMSKMDRIAQNWGETSITDILIAEVGSAVVVHRFSQSNESYTGADWIWWWVDDFYSYGMLVQAKRVTITKREHWKFNFGYLSGKKQVSQRSTLLTAAKRLGLLPVYCLYLGTGAYRGWASCGVRHEGNDCPSCNQRSVSLMPAQNALDNLIVDAKATYSKSIALETVSSSMSLSPTTLIEDHITPELATLLRKMQDGVLTVVQNMASLATERKIVVGKMVELLKQRESRTDRRMDLIVKQESQQNRLQLKYRDYLASVLADHVHTKPPNSISDNIEFFFSPLRKRPPRYVSCLREILHEPELENKLRDLVDSEFDVITLPDNIAGIVVIDVS